MSSEWSPDRPWGRLRGARQVRAREVMTAEPLALTPQSPLADAARLMAELDVGILPVVQTSGSRRLRGVITDRDIVIRAVANALGAEAPVAEVMTHRIETVGPNDSIQDVLRLMKQARVRRVPVVDRRNRLLGIVSQADLAVAYARLDLDRELEVQEVIERISEPLRPQRRLSGDD